MRLIRLSRSARPSASTGPEPESGNLSESTPPQRACGPRPRARCFFIAIQSMTSPFYNLSLSWERSTAFARIARV
jgi:hypothetical protein